MARFIRQALTPEQKAWLLLAITVLFWGANLFAARLAVGQISPATLVSSRWVLVALILLAIGGRPMRAEFRTLTPHWAFIFVMGAVGLTVSNGLIYLGAQFTTGINVSILQGGMPLWTMLAAWRIFKIPISGAQWVGLALTMIGLVIVVTGGRLATLTEMSFNIGDVISIVSTIAYGGYVVALARRPASSPLTFFTAVSMAAAVASLPLVPIEWAFGQTYAPTWTGIAITVFAALFASLLGQVFFLRATDTIGPQRTSMFNNLTPVIGATLSVIFLGERLHLYHALGIALVLGGVVLAEIAGRRLRARLPR